MHSAERENSRKCHSGIFYASVAIGHRGIMFLTCPSICECVSRWRYSSTGLLSTSSCLKVSSFHVLMIFAVAVM